MPAKTDKPFRDFLEHEKSNIAKIIDKATDVLGTHEKAVDWVDHVSATLGDTPSNLSATDDGTRAVLLHLGAISRHSHT